MLRILTRCGQYFSVLLVIALGPRPAIAQAWTVPAGEAYVKLFYGEVTAGHQYTFDGRVVDFINDLPGDTYRDRSLYVYSEVGVSDRFSALLSFPYKRTFVRDHAFRFRLYSPGAVMLGGRYSMNDLFGLNANKYRVALNVQVFIPAGYVRNYTPSSGGGQVDMQGMLFYGISLHPLPAYLQVGAGYRYRSAIYLFSKEIDCVPGNDIHCIRDTQPDYKDEWIFHIEAGAAPIGNVVHLQVLGRGSFSVDKPEIGFSPLNPVPTSQRYVKLGAGVTVFPLHFLKTFALSSLGFNAQYFETPYGRNTIKSRDLFVGFEYRHSFSGK